MNRIIKTVLTAAIIVMSTAAAATAYSDVDFSDAEFTEANGFYTIIVDTQGKTHTFDGIVNVEKLEQSEAVNMTAEYAICENDRELLRVKLNDIVYENNPRLFESDGKPVINGYYSVDFEISDTDKTRAFLTGLTPANAAKVQKEIVASRLDGSDFNMESLDFIDAEKTLSDYDGDNELCWAATASNMLHYTGWAQKAGLYNEDDVFDLLNENFIDMANFDKAAVHWLINGTYGESGDNDDTPIINYGGSGGYLKQYDASTLVKYTEMGSEPEKITEMMSCLRKGCGVGIDIDWAFFQDDDVDIGGAHAVTMWGYIYDENYGSDDKEYYRAFIISDSDSNERTDTNRRVAPNELNIRFIEPIENKWYDSWRFINYGGGVLRAYTVLQPYSDDIAYETDTAASCDKFADDDMYIDDVFVSSVPGEQTNISDAFAKNQDIYITPGILNNTDKKFSGDVEYNVKIINNGSEVFNENYVHLGTLLPYIYDHQAESACFFANSPGKYTVTVTVNPSRQFKEAYYFNNSFSREFTVTDTEYDLSAVRLDAQIEEFLSGSADVQLTCSGLDTIGSDAVKDLKRVILVSYFKNGEWSAWNKTYSGGAAGKRYALLSDENVCNEECMVYTQGEKVKFRIIFVDENGVIPSFSVVSDEYRLDYSQLAVNEGELNTGTYTKLPINAKSLADGEKFSFSIDNISTYDFGDISFNAVVYAESDGECAELYRQDDISLGLGDPSVVITFDTWNADLSGSYTIIAKAEYGDTSYQIVLGDMFVHEKPSFTVNITDDTTNPYDGGVSLREAIRYLSEYGTAEDKITVDAEKINLDETITIDNKIVIDNGTNHEIAITTEKELQLFKISESGELNMSRFIFEMGSSKDYGGAVYNDGGKVTLDSCQFNQNDSGRAGGAIYTDGGSVTIKNCLFYQNRSGYGGAAAVDGGAELNILNSIFCANSSNSGAVYNNNGTVNAVYSSFLSNDTNSSGNGAITSNGVVNMAGCIEVFNNGKGFGENVNIYGSYVEKIGGAKTDGLTVPGNGEELVMYYGGDILSKPESDTGLPVPSLTSKIYDGVYIKNIDGKLAYSSDGTDWRTTDIKSVFTDGEYSHDMAGNPHGRLFGSYAKTAKGCIFVDDSEAFGIFVPEAKQSTVICVRYNDDGSLNNMSATPTELKCGMNELDIDADIFNSGSGGYVKIMVWDSIDGMNPELESFDIFLIT